MGKTSTYHLILFLLICVPFIYKGQKPIEISGPNWVPIMENAEYYIDSTNQKDATLISSNLSKFKNNNNAFLILKKQPYNLWVHLKIKNTGKNQHYFLGLYSQIDTLEVYQKKRNIYTLKNLSNYGIPSKKRNQYNVRFHLSDFDLKENEEIDLLLKVVHKRHYTGIYADFTTSIANIIWETKFNREVGFFLGIFFIIALISIVMSIFSKEKVFFIYGFYIALIFILILQEELFISIFQNPVLYTFLYRLNSVHYLLIAMGLNLFLFLDITEIKKNFNRLYSLILYFSYFIFGLGILVSSIYFIFFKNLSFAQSAYSLFWDFNIFLLIIAIILTTLIIVLHFIKKGRYFLGITIGLLYLFFNPVTYYLNYSKILLIYEITYPNYFYYFLVIEIFVFGGIISSKYRNIVRSRLRIMTDKVNLQNENYIILQEQEEKIKKNIVESQEYLLKKLSQDLHDDIGQKLTIINFSVENLKLTAENPSQIGEIRESILEISNSIRNLSHWLNDFNLENLNIDEIIENDIQRLKSYNLIKINYKKIDNEKQNYKTSVTENIILYRIFQEVTNNILKHSSADTIDILIDFSQKIYIEISDNGIGFNENKQKGNGLKNIFQRAQIINYKSEINSIVNSGTSIKIYKP